MFAKTDPRSSRTVSLRQLITKLLVTFCRAEIEYIAVWPLNVTSIKDHLCDDCTTKFDEAMIRSYK